MDSFLFRLKIGVCLCLSTCMHHVNNNYYYISIIITFKIIILYIFILIPNRCDALLGTFSIWGIERKKKKRILSEILTRFWRTMCLQ